MFSSPTPASGSRAIAANALRNAGLIDRDAQMLDASDNPGGRKGSSRARAHRARKKESSGASARPVSSSFLVHVLLRRDYSNHSGNKDKQCQKLGVFLSPFLCQVREWCWQVFIFKSGRSSVQHASETLAAHMTPISDPLSIRGAARPTAAGRLRRNAVSSSTPSTGPSALPRIPAPRLVPASKSTKLVEHWRQLVKKRWNPETRFLNLEVSIITFWITSSLSSARSGWKINGARLPTVYLRQWSKMTLLRSITWPLLDQVVLLAMLPSSSNSHPNWRQKWVFLIILLSCAEFRRYKPFLSHGTTLRGNIFPFSVDIFRAWPIYRYKITIFVYGKTWTLSQREKNGYYTYGSWYL